MVFPGVLGPSRGTEAPWERRGWNLQVAVPLEERSVPAPCQTVWRSVASLLRARRSGGAQRPCSVLDGLEERSVPAPCQTVWRSVASLLRARRSGGAQRLCSVLDGLDVCQRRCTVQSEAVRHAALKLILGGFHRNGIPHSERLETVVIGSIYDTGQSQLTSEKFFVFSQSQISNIGKIVELQTRKWRYDESLDHVHSIVFTAKDGINK